MEIENSLFNIHFRITTNKQIIGYLLLFLVLLGINGCSEDKKTIQISGRTMGTSYHISLVDPLSKVHSRQDQLKKELEKLLTRINQQMSTYIADSEVSQFNQSATTRWFSVSADVIHVVKAAQKISRITQGAFDITVGPLVNLWGFGKKIQLKIPNSKQIATLRKAIGYQLLEYQENPPALRKKHPRLQIDLSAIAKGYAVDKLSDYLLQQNYKNFMVEIGGEIKVAGHNSNEEKWKIIIQNPKIILNKNPPSKRLLMSNQAVATSGNYLNFFLKEGIRYSHILDPRTGLPKIHKLISITVLHPSAMIADAYATALMVLSADEGDKLARQQGLDVYKISED